jgi:membrane protease YdiL (CAAX protease family)
MAEAPAHAAAGDGPARLALALVAVWLAAALVAPLVGIWWAVGGAAIVLGGAVAWVAGSSLRPLLTPAPRLVALGLIAGAATVAASYALYPLLVRLAPWATLEAELLYAAFRAPSLLVASVVLVPVIVGEELVWRGVVQGTLARRLGPWGAAWTAGALYALVSVAIGSPLLALVSLAMGLVWGLLRAWTGSLVPTLVAHLVWNAVVLLWLPFDAV